MRRLTILLLLSAGCGPPPLTFSALRVDELTATRAVIRFTTSRPSTCEIELGLTATALDRRFTDPGMADGQLVTEHEVPLEGLEPNQTFFFRARAVDEAGDRFFSAIQEFSTPPATGPTLTNLALRTAGATVVSVSSTWGGGGHDSAFGPNKAIDGEFSTEWSSNGDGDAARFELDLGQTRRLSAFGFRSRSMSDGTAIITRVGLSLDGSTQLEFDTPDPTRLYVFQFAALVDARRAVIRAVTTTSGNTGAKEIQLLAP